MDEKNKNILMFVAMLVINAINLDTYNERIAK